MAQLLIVDDDPSIRQLIRRTLERMGHTMIEADNGRDALRQLSGQKIDLVLLDINMPQMEGIQAVQEIRRLFPRVRIIVISGIEMLYLRASELLGAEAAIRKPFHVDELRDAVSRVLGVCDQMAVPAGQAQRS
jgi:CheY-like chemotaxis protein